MPRTVMSKNSRDRRAMDKSVPANRAPAVISSVVLSSPTVVELTFAASVIPNKLPRFAAGGESVVSMSRVSDTVVEFTFSGSVAGATLVVEEGDPGIRTMTGGFIPAGSYAIPLT